MATAILLADRLQNGLIEDNLFWYWDAFQDHYTLMPAWQRAAIMNGYAQAHRDNLVDLFDPPSPEVRQSHDRDAVERAFAEAAPEAVPPGCAAGAVLLGDPELGNALWSLFATQGGPQPLTGMALRHIYETNPAFDPLPGQWFDAMGESPPPIPRADRD
ncbi:hypothetical protein [Ovoidimarina sediminis]|uniref:hypothetical protein n=1 Tax=Ovoidimarina sediminis TaxID=3079856 RepID=UPI00290FBE08|nr:hypothetical protein [Rhodophyticola sp. MJ-SS7]MDU8942551.1 hypothetical protein [Rhodophyticola sp. MJ-SS7]